MGFFLRVNYLGGQDRYEKLWRVFRQAAVYPLPARPGFTADGKTDATDYMLCAWQQGYPGPTILRHLDNRHVQNRWDGSLPYPDARTAPSDRQLREITTKTLEAWSA